jgi:hypothetical protein
MRAPCLLEPGRGKSIARQSAIDASLRRIASSIRQRHQGSRYEHSGEKIWRLEENNNEEKNNQLN